MKKIILSIVIVLIIVSISLFVRNGVTKQDTKSKNNNIVTVFDIPGKGDKVCYPIEIIDYKDTINSKGELMIFGRTVWSEDADSQLGGKPAAVPIRVFQKGAGEDALAAEMVSSSMDGHFVVILKETDKTYYVNIDVANAEDCPERFKSLPKEAAQPLLK